MGTFLTQNNYTYATQSYAEFPPHILNTTEIRENWNFDERARPWTRARTIRVWKKLFHIWLTLVFIGLLIRCFPGAFAQSIPQEEDNSSPYWSWEHLTQCGDSFVESSVEWAASVVLDELVFEAALKAHESYESAQEVWGPFVADVMDATSARVHRFYNLTTFLSHFEQDRSSAPLGPSWSESFLAYSDKLVSFYIVEVGLRVLNLMVLILAVYVFVFGVMPHMILSYIYILYLFSLIGLWVMVSNFISTFHVYGAGDHLD